MIEVQVRTNWFELESRTRRDYAKQLDEIIERYPDIRFRWFDAEAWTGKFTDFVLCEFSDLDSYNSLWGELRRHPFLCTPFATISRVILGMEIKTPQTPLGLEKPVAPVEPEKDAAVVPEPASEPAPSAPTLSEAPPAQQAKPQRTVCPECGKSLKASARFCSGCGSKAGPAAPGPDASQVALGVAPAPSETLPLG